MTNTSFKCSTCPAEFKTERGLLKHRCRWICQRCKRTYFAQQGFDKHRCVLSRAQKDAEREMKRQESLRKMEEEESILVEKVIAAGLFQPKFEPGQAVHVSTYMVSKPTHQQRGTRLVRVRYEEERRYYVYSGEITEALVYRNKYTLESCLETQKLCPVVYKIGWQTYDQHQIFTNKEEAEQVNQEQAKNYQEACDHASFCR